MRMRIILVVATSWFVTLLLASSAWADASWRVGVARENITPQQAMWMSGYGARDRPADGKLTELWGKAIAIEDAGGNRVVLVTLDLVGIDRPTAEAIRSGVEERYRLPREALALSTSHTHSGPVVGQNLGAMYFLDQTGWGLVDRYTQQLIEKVTAMVGRAIDELRPAKVAWTVGRAHFAVNRRNNPEGEVPALRTADKLVGPVDHDVPILVVKESNASVDEDRAERLLAIVCGYACHATVLSGYQWSGDWPGYAQIAIEERFPGVTAMVWAGCGADQNPLPRRDVELAQQYGREIDRAVARAFEQPLIEIQGSLETQFAEIRLPFDGLPTREQLEQTKDSTNRYEASRATLLLETLKREGALQPDYPYPIQLWRLGDGPKWIFLGGEVVVDYALRLKLELGAARTWVAGYCNDVMAYIPSRRVRLEGGYEGGGAMLYYGLPAPWHESVEDRIMAEVGRQVAAVGGPAQNERRSIDAPAYPDHSDLKVWRDDQGELREIRGADDWQRRRRDILTSMQVVMGRLPQDAELEPLQVEVLQSEAFPDYERQRIFYRVDRDGGATAHLYLPKRPEIATGQRRPAVVALHPTSPLGKGVVAGEGPRPNRGYAAELAQRGYIVLAPDYPSFGDLADYNFHTDAYVSGTMRGIVNHRRGVDLLAARPDVDPDRLAAIGHSLGGHNAIFLGAFDERIKGVVSSCGWDPFHFYYGGRLAGWASDRYMPRIRELYGLEPDRMPFDFPEVIAAIAPRGFFSSSPLHDNNFDAAGVMHVEPEIRRVFQLLGAESNLVIAYPDADHDFPEDLRREAFEFLDRVLKVDPERLNR